jgi:hypothetical protein
VKKIFVYIIIFSFLLYSFFYIGLHWHGTLSDYIFPKKLTCFSHNNFLETFQTDCYYPLNNKEVEFYYTNKLHCQYLTNHQLEKTIKEKNSLKKIYNLITMIKTDYRNFDIDINDIEEKISKSKESGESDKEPFKIIVNNNRIVTGFRKTQYTDFAYKDQYLTLSKKNGKGIIYWINTIKNDQNIASDFFQCQPIKNTQKIKRYFDENDEYYLDIPEYFVLNKEGENGIIFEKSIDKKSQVTNNYIAITKGTNIRNPFEKIEALKEIKIGEQKLVLKNENEEMNQFNIYKRLPDVKINNENFYVFINKNPFEAEKDSLYYLYLSSDNDYLIEALINNDKNKKNNISFDEFNSIINTLKFNLKKIKKYINNQIGISFEYPANLYIGESYDNNKYNYYKKIYLSNNPNEVIEPKSDSIDAPFEIAFYSNEKIIELAIDKPLDKAILEFENHIKNSFLKKSLKIENIILDGKPAQLLSGEYSDYFAGFKAKKHKVIIVKSKNGIYLISNYFQIKDENYTDVIFEKITSTISFSHSSFN